MNLRLALTLAAAGLVVNAAPAWGADIQISINGGSRTKFVQTQTGLINERMTVRDQGSGGERAYSGWSISQVTGVPASAISSALVSLPDGTSDSLQPADIDPGWDADGDGHNEVPLFETVGSQLAFVRPPRDAADRGRYILSSQPLAGVNPDIYLQIATGGRQVLNVGVIQASPSQPKPNDQVTFSHGVVVGASPPLSYAWDFGDSGSATDDQPVHAFTTAGSFPVTLTVTDGAGNSGVSPVLVLPVSNPAPQTTATPSAGGTGSQDALPTGPVNGGQTPSSAPTPAATTSKPRRGSSGGATPHKKTPAKGTDRTLKQATPTPTAVSSPSSSPTATPESSATSSGRRRSSASGGRDDKPPPAPAGTPAPVTPPTTFGVLVGTSAPQAAADPAAVALAQRLAAARKAAANDQAHDSVHALDTLLGVAAALMVLALGALRELHPRARYRRLAT